MSLSNQPRAFWGRARLWFRRFRLGCWLALLALLGLVLYLHHFGLPAPLKRATIHAFAEAGLELKFSELRLAWIGGVVARDVVLRPLTDQWAPQVEARRVSVDLAAGPLLRLKLRPESVTMTEGALRLPCLGPDGRPFDLTATNIQGTVRLNRGGGWHLDTLRGNLDELRLSASGSVTNTHLLRDWRMFEARETAHEAALPQTLGRIAEVLDSLAFSRPPGLRVGFQLDGAAPDASSLWVALDAAEAESPYGTWQGARFTLTLVPAPDETVSRLELSAQADGVQTQWGDFADVRIQAGLDCRPEEVTIETASLDITGRSVDTGWADGEDLKARIELTFAADGRTATAARFDVRCEEISTGLGCVERVRLQGEARRVAPGEASLNHVPGEWLQQLDGFAGDVRLELGLLHETTFSATNISARFAWDAPRLELVSLTGGFPGGPFDLRASLNAATGEVECHADSRLDPKRFAGVLPPEVNEWLDRYTWEQPPHVQGRLALLLPQWTPDDLGWPGDVRPSLVIDARFESGPGGFLGMPVRGASSALHYSNMFWHLPELILEQPDGRVFIEHINNDRTSEYLFRVKLRSDPAPAWALLSPDAVAARETLGMLQFDSPPHADCLVTGFWRDGSRLHLEADLRATNVTFRGVTMDEVSAAATFTNAVLRVIEPSVRRGKRMAAADEIEFHFREDRAFLSNGTSTLPPLDIATVIGEDVVRTIEPYRYLTPPRARVEGVIPLGNIEMADLRFELEGGPFEWWKFQLPTLDGTVHWRGHTVGISNLHAAFYGGAAEGRMFLDFRDRPAPDFNFKAEVFGADLQPLVTGLFDSTNRLEGRLSGTLNVTQANTDDFQSWFGHGTATLVDGFLWEIPVFGVVSPLLELMAPGLGHSRANAASGTYTITNSVIRTEDLVIRSTNMRLRYKGTLDFEGRLDATAEAELLRDTLIIGQAISLVFTPVSKLLVLELGGTLADPQARPQYVLPRLLLAPLNPLKLFKDLFGPDEPVPANGAGAKPRGKSGKAGPDAPAAPVHP